jgi:uncharacterized protein YbjT (DUF2867 family)
LRILAGVRDKNELDVAGNSLSDGVTLEPVYFDFADSKSVDAAVSKCDSLFLLRPPQLTDVQGYFAPVVNSAKRHNIEHIVFLSVQGVEQSSFIPHHKIERVIRESGIPYTFLRPAYFMQNFTTTLREDIAQNDLIYLPAGNSHFTVVDVADVGRVAAQVLLHPESHQNTAYDITNREQLTFVEMARILSEVLGRSVVYRSPNLLSFYWRKRRAGMPHGFVMVMILLHALPRFRPTPVISTAVEDITGQEPQSFRSFVEDNKLKLEKPPQGRSFLIL